MTSFLSQLALTRDAALDCAFGCRAPFNGSSSWFDPHVNGGLAFFAHYSTLRSRDFRQLIVVFLLDGVVFLGRRSLDTHVWHFILV